MTKRDKFSISIEFIVSYFIKLMTHGLKKISYPKVEAHFFMFSHIPFYIYQYTTFQLSKRSNCEKRITQSLFPAYFASI